MNADRNIQNHILILQVHPSNYFTKNNRILVRGVNIVKRHTAPSQASQGGIIDKEISIHISNIAHIDPKDSKATRVGYKFLDDGRKVRFSKRSGDLID